MRQDMDEGPRYNRSAEAAAHIVNTIMNSDAPPAIKFAKTLYTILQAMDDAEADLREVRMVISRN